MAKSKATIVTGIEEIDRRLRQLEPAIGKKVVRQAIRQALKPVLAAAKANAPVESGALKRSIKLRAVKPKVRRKGVVGLDVRVDKDSAEGGAWYAPRVELGDSTHVGHPFMAPAYAAQGPKAREIAQRLILAGVMHQVRLLGKE
ncbi:HK97-gp10 family putative phage morphogenesis protein [Paludisphaera rhizosphaerae]|uniref:HK97-gp10 family putative phage morphogenesis protein n=1 Tax=Paludisphaera rhizosphaerae TaxID=2711216 RepID=UPI0013ED365F|nr:HK97-gp10 family putative phage morphogenesis protein [Paludisphaera rhizosphaerae]